MYMYKHITCVHTCVPDLDRYMYNNQSDEGRLSHDRMVVGFITTYAITRCLSLGELNLFMGRCTRYNIM